MPIAPSVSRDAILYEAVQRSYRPSVIAHIRTVLTAKFGEGEGVRLLRTCFEESDWNEVSAAATQARASGSVSTAPEDDYDLLDVAKFGQVIERYFDLLFPGPDGEMPRFRSARRQQVVSLARLVRNVRDPISHPVTEEISATDAQFTIDAARRLVERFDQATAARLVSLYESVDTPDADTDRSKLLDNLPSELAVRRFVGRRAELDALWSWLFDADQDRWLLAGEGGRGKSATAHEFGRQVRDRAPTPFAAVLWMSAKRRALVDREVKTIGAPDITDLASGIGAAIEALGFRSEAPVSGRERRAYVEQLLADFPTLIILDDVDSLEGEDQDVVEFFSRIAFKTSSKLLLTSRRQLAAMEAITTSVEGLPLPDGLLFIESKIMEFRLDPASFADHVRRRIHETTEGNPLFIEDLLRLTLTGLRVESAIATWKDKKGDVAREYALGREVDFLSPDARRVLIAAALPTQAVTHEELRLVTGLSEDALDRGISELQGLFLLSGPRLIENVERLELDSNTRLLVLRAIAPRYPDDEARLRGALTNLLSGTTSRSRRGRVGEFVRQARILSQAGRDSEAEATLRAGLDEFPEDPLLIGQLAVVYKMWHPKPRVTDARASFERARDLGSNDPALYSHWIEMERSLEQWSAAAKIGMEALQRVPDDQYVRYQTGYVTWQHARVQRRQFNEGALRTLEEGIRILRSAILDPADLPTNLSRLTNAKAFRAVTYALADDLRFRLDDGLSPSDRSVVSTRKGLEEVLERWEKEHPDDYRPAVARTELANLLAYVT